MCCFHPRVESVRKTKIFARHGAEGRQFLAYAMSKSSVTDVAMILPLPTPPNSPEDAIKWISLKEFPTFFDALNSGYPVPKSDPPIEAKPTPRALAVVEVGDFEASFVPGVKDFERLDERFRIPATTWESLPVKGFGFAVFKLKMGAQDVHPMAFDFPRAAGTKLFFPTIHIHDGKVHATADFDHVLYCQGERLEVHDWEESPQPAGLFVPVAKTKGLVDGDAHLYRLFVTGERKNEDILV